jgi:GAF domain-containing protein
MESLKLLIVSIRKEWQSLIAESLHAAGYNYKIITAATKQLALQACYQDKFDLVISNCSLPDGQVSDLVSVLGNQIPCLVMAEGVCPAHADKNLSILTTSFYPTSANKIRCLEAMQTTLAKWQQNAIVRLALIGQNQHTFHEKILDRCREELTPLNFKLEKESCVLNTLHVLTEALDVSCAYICQKITLPDSLTGILKTTEYAAPGVYKQDKTSLTHSQAGWYPYFKRWDRIFEHGEPVASLLSELPQSEQHMFHKRDIVSILAVPFFYQNRWAGFVGIEDTMNQREWMTDEIALIQSVCGLLHEKYCQKEKSSHFESGTLQVTLDPVL